MKCAQILIVKILDFCRVIVFVVLANINWLTSAGKTYAMVMKYCYKVASQFRFAETRKYTSMRHKIYLSIFI